MIDPTERPGFSRSLDRTRDAADPLEPELGSLPDTGFSDEEMKNVTKTGTTTVGVTTADGVIVATDMRASLGGRFVANKNVQKVEQIHPTGALTMAGSVGGAQSFIRSLRVEANLYEARRGEHMSMEALSTLAGNFIRGGPFFAVNPLLGGVDDEGHHVYSIDPAGGVMRDDYTVTGSGMQLAYGVLEREYEEDLSNEEGMQVVARAVKSAVERDAASGDGIFLAEITEEGVDIEGHKEFDEVL
ncbi:proteasome endopeptidase complex, archaeal, beta subunit [Halobacteriales archaeon QS_1_68_20]|nr:MAG: proteasome endopeptidase complex, archaeal, beta subunit [Halobacteriales archaeon QS_1_68_20]